LIPFCDDPYTVALGVGKITEPREDPDPVASVRGTNVGCR
jgi:hypothetical protein